MFYYNIMAKSTILLDKVITDLLVNLLNKCKSKELNLDSINYM